jgi:hypothetical protein
MQGPGSITRSCDGTASSAHANGSGPATVDDIGGRLDGRRGGRVNARARTLILLSLFFAPMAASSGELGKPLQLQGNQKAELKEVLREMKAALPGEWPNGSISESRIYEFSGCKAKVVEISKGAATIYETFRFDLRDLDSDTLEVVPADKDTPLPQLKLSTVGLEKRIQREVRIVTSDSTSSSNEWDGMFFSVRPADVQRVKALLEKAIALCAEMRSAI